MPLPCLDLSFLCQLDRAFFPRSSDVSASSERHEHLETVPSHHLLKYNNPMSVISV